MTLDDLLKTVLIGTDAEAYKAMYELNSSALHEMTKYPHQVIKYSRILRQIQYLAGNDCYSFLFEAGKLCGCVEAFEAITKKTGAKMTPEVFAVVIMYIVPVALFIITS